jgi:hypothetical protein
MCVYYRIMCVSARDRERARQRVFVFEVETEKG